MRGSMKLAANHTATVELTGSRTGVRSELTPSQFSTSSSSNAAIGNNFYPVNGPHYLNLKNYGVLDFDPTKPIAYRFRMQDWGNRVIDNISSNSRLLMAMDGAGPENTTTNWACLPRRPRPIRICMTAMPIPASSMPR